MQEMQFQPLGQKDPLQKEMATHSSIPAWEIPWTEQPGGLQSMGSQIETIKQPTPVFLPGEFHEQRSLEGYSPWGCKELDTTEQLRPSLSLSGSYSSEDSVRIILRDKNVGDFAYSGMSSVQKLIT